jgi:hypothetical protein
MNIHCAICGKRTTHNIYYCPKHTWHIRWKCVKKAALTYRLSCPKCDREVNRVD